MFTFQGLHQIILRSLKNPLQHLEASGGTTLSVKDIIELLQIQLHQFAIGSFTKRKEENSSSTESFDIHFRKWEDGFAGRIGRADWQC